MADRPTWSRSYWFDRCILAVLIASTAWLSLALARGPGELAAIWIGNGILAGWLLSRRTTTWRGYIAVAFVAELAARMLAGDEAPYAVAIAACNLIEALVVAGAVRWRVSDTRDPRDWMRMGGIATAATLLACAGSGALAAGVAHAMHAQPFLPALGRWFSAHVVGMVVVATMTLVAQRERTRLFALRGRTGSLLASLALLVATTAGVFLTDYAVLFLAYPPLLLVAVQHRFVGAGLGVIAMALVAATLTTLGHGPLWQQGLDDTGRIALIQLYIAGGCLMTIPVCLALAERDRLAGRLRESERRYRMLADHSHDAITRVRADGERVYVSPAATEMLGWDADELLGSRWSIVHPDDRDALEQSMASALASGEPRTDQYRLRHREGHYVWVEAVSRAIPADDGSGRTELMINARNISRRVAAEQALAESRRELERQSRVDPLTDLANRRQFDERLSLACKRLQRHGTPIGLLAMDIDRFKSINDGHGHATGDAVLQAFARRLCESVRETDLVARVGGDEFVILLEDGSADGAEAVARKVVAAMTAPVEAGGKPLEVSTSIGVAHAREPVDPATLMARADAALYVAKQAGRNRYHVATPY
ncbi:diguanylate cyclase [Luteimonas sp. M1R5S18]|uniref:Diguanylate cyclase n=1 Tax=Luteimonas rhizosphaericola TaxID=3042024 RepID=A0ABT6JHP5_9GAMM|nr:sensor domain-containing diguanylate cyclase [Luteimonas rhizosphaericola]MDH5830195.1 diguanylate cyclase [Luteimonas rhizosphaericola]